jgi:hypothetical protein
VIVAVEMLVNVAVPRETSVSGFKPNTRKGRASVVAGVALGARTAFFELPVAVLPVLLIMATFWPIIARAPEAIAVVAEQTTAENTVSGSSQTIAIVSPAAVLAG